VTPNGAATKLQDVHPFHQLADKRDSMTAVKGVAKQNTTMLSRYDLGFIRLTLTDKKLFGIIPISVASANV
jgi:hypothetical protein